MKYWQATIQVDLENIMPTEKSQSVTKDHVLAAFMWPAQNGRVYRERTWSSDYLGLEEGKWLLSRDCFLGFILKWPVMVVQLCDYTKNHKVVTLNEWIECYMNNILIRLLFVKVICLVIELGAVLFPSCYLLCFLNFLQWECFTLTIWKINDVSGEEGFLESHLVQNALPRGRVLPSPTFYLILTVLFLI